MELNETVTTAEASKIIGVQFETFRQRFKRGRLGIEPVGSVAGAYLWDRREIERLARQEVAAK